MALLPTVTDPPSGSATGFYTGYLDTKHQLETNDQAIEDRLEATITNLFGNGVVAGSYTPPILAAGTGLTVNVAGLTALIGFLFVEASGVVTLPASSTSHIYLYQDGTFDHNTSGTNPGTSDNPAIELGTATTDGSGVTGVTVTAPIIGGGLMPIGGIIMWSGAVVDIPSNWQLCDGTNGTPDLRDRFIVGAGSTYSPGDTGGSATSTASGTTTADAAGGSLVNIDPVMGGGTTYYAYTALANDTTHDHDFSDSLPILPPYLALCYIQRIS